MIKKIFNKNIKVKYLYLISVAIILLISGVLYITYAMVTASINPSSTIGLASDTTYEFKVNDNQTFEIESDNIVTFNIAINNTTDGNIQYELYYYSESDLNNVLIAEVVNDTSLEAKNTNGNLAKDENKVIPLVIKNNSLDKVSITIGVVSGFSNKTINYGQDDYPEGTKITSTYNIDKISNECYSTDVSNCKLETRKTYEIINGQTKEVIKEVYVCNTTITKTDFVVNKPDLIDGMIPISYKGISWVKADSSNENNNWYDYENKKWANVALVKTVSAANKALSDGTVCTGTDGYCTREDYMNASVDVTIPEADILAYYVWIPRFAYKIFNEEFLAVDPQEIEVVFLEGLSKMNLEIECKLDNINKTFTCESANGKMKTHPAFTFNNIDLKGFWIGKFETTGNGTTPTVKPNIAPIGNVTAVNHFNYNKKFASTTYLTETGVNVVDSHMIKNMEWGAVAYLKQSKYGLGITDVALNNFYSSGYKTGCGSAIGTVAASTTCNAYNTSIGMNASTTGNVYGVYDMAGGINEVVMATIETSAGGALTYSSSGFNATSLPYGSPYVDMYAYSETDNTQDDYNRSKLGDALGETRGWYSDSQSFINSTNPWLYRGGIYNSASYGIFYFGRSTGTNSAAHGTRSILVKTT